MAQTPIPASAVQDMTVAEVRRALGKIRQLWYQSSPAAPLFICDPLVRDKTIAEFCTEFVYGRHLKRHQKSTQQQRLQNALDVNSGKTAPNRTATGVAGPKGDDDEGTDDRFPFTPGWEPKSIPADAYVKWWDPSRELSKDLSKDPAVLPSATDTPAPLLTKPARKKNKTK
jgi:hypothetical protein